MIEPLRSQYLAALGVENYVPRFVLPHAKLSEPCEWLDAPVESANPALLIEERILAVASAESTQSAFSEKPAQRAPIVESEIKRSARIVENNLPKAPAVQGEVGPQFALSIVLAGGGVLLIDAAPASSAERTAFQALLNNMLPALRPAAGQYVLDIFLWPMTKQPKIQRDADAAKETLAAYLNKQIKQRSIDVVLLLGEAAQQWCVFDSDVCVIKSSSLLACVKDPALKRPLWNDIRHIAEK